MKLISINIWGGRRYEALMNFITNQATNTDFFCLQECFDTDSQKIENNGWRVNILQELKNVLCPEFNCFFSASQMGFDLSGPVDFEIRFGLALFYKTNTCHALTALRDVFIHGKLLIGRKKTKRPPRNIQHMHFINNDNNYSIFNYHGLHLKHKQDTRLRIRECKKIKKLMTLYTSKLVLCGDLNLERNTKSIDLLSENMINLIEQHDVKSTRTYFYTKPIKEADYIIVSPSIKVRDFEAQELWPDPVADHKPLILKFE